MKKFSTILVLLMLILPCGLKAQTRESGRPLHSSFQFHFRHDKYDFDSNYRQNKEKLKSLNEFLSREIEIDSIIIYSYASPEGVYEHNVWLSKNRGATLKRLIKRQLKEHNYEGDIVYSLNPGGEDWVGFEKVLTKSYWRADRAQVLSIVRSNIKNDVKKWRLKQLSNGESWSYIIYNLAYNQRQATSIIIYYRPAGVLAKVEEPSRAAEIEEDPIADYQEFIAPPATRAKAAKQTIFALKTNLIFDALTTVNYAIEVPLGNTVSFQFQQNTPWWLSKNNQYCNQILSLGGELRYWLGERTRLNRLTGHCLGINCFSGTSDLQWQRNICYQSTYLSAGISYAYSMPIGKLFNLEFCASVGYARINYQHYKPSSDYQILYRDYSDYGTLNYFGPTKLEVSFIIPIRAKIGGGR